MPRSPGVLWAAVAAVVVVTACGRRGSQPIQSEESQVSLSESKQSTISARLVALEPGPRPPESIWTFHIEFDNPTAEPRWFALSKTLGAALDQITAAPGVRLDAVASPQGRVPVVRVMSGYEVVAFLLPPGGRLVIERMPLSCWQEAGVDQLEVWALRDIAIAGTPIGRGWLKGHSLTAPQQARVAQYGGLEPIYKHMDENLENSPVALERVRRFTIPIDRGTLALPWDGHGPPLDVPLDDPGPGEPLPE